MKVREVPEGPKEGTGKVSPGNYATARAGSEPRTVTVEWEGHSYVFRVQPLSWRKASRIDEEAQQVEHRGGRIVGFQIDQTGAKMAKLKAIVVAAPEGFPCPLTDEFFDTAGAEFVDKLAEACGLDRPGSMTEERRGESGRLSGAQQPVTAASSDSSSSSPSGGTST